MCLKFISNHTTSLQVTNYTSISSPMYHADNVRQAIDHERFDMAQGDIGD